MRLAIPVYHLRRSGGLERYTWEVGRGLAGAGHDVCFVAPGASAEQPPPSTTLDPLRGGSRANSVLGAIETLTFGLRASVRLARHHRERLVYGPLGSHYRPGVVTAQSVHAAWIRDREQYLGAARPTPFDRGLAAMERATYRRQDIVVTALSPICAEDVTEMYDVEPERITIVPPAADLSVFRQPTPEQRAAARRRFGSPDDQLVVGVVANYAFERKCVANLIEAVARTGAVLMVAGVADRRLSDYERLAADTGANVRFLGHVGDVDVFYHAIDVFALPSVNEAYGIAAHEAMASGLPAILSTRCGIAGLLEAGRHYVEVHPADTADLVEAIARLSSDEARDEISRCGTAWARSRTWDDVAAEIGTVLASHDVSRRADR